MHRLFRDILLSCGLLFLLLAVSQPQNPPTRRAKRSSSKPAWKHRPQPTWGQCVPWSPSRTHLYSRCWLRKTHKAVTIPTPTRSRDTLRFHGHDGEGQRLQRTLRGWRSRFCFQTESSTAAYSGASAANHPAGPMRWLTLPARDCNTATWTSSGQALQPCDHPVPGRQQSPYSRRGGKGSAASPASRSCCPAKCPGSPRCRRRTWRRSKRW